MQVRENTKMMLASDRVWLTLLTSALLACSAVGSPTPSGTNRVDPGDAGGLGGTGGGASINLVVGSGGVPFVVGNTGGNSAPTVDNNCGNDAKTMTQTPADLLLVLDRSGSMANDIASDDQCDTSFGGCAERWATMIQAMRVVLVASPASINWGLKFFSSPSWTSSLGTTPKGCVVLPEMDVPIDTGNGDKIVNAIVGVTPNNNTPTRAAIETATAYLNKLADTRSKNILLATDGEPNCNSDGSYATSEDEEGTFLAIEAAKAAGVRVFVIGVGPYEKNLTEMARRGGTEKFYPALSPQSLVAALQAIVGSVASCVYTMSSTPPDPNNLGVYLDKQMVAQNPSNGWILSGPNEVTFTGKTCDGIKAGQYKDVQVLFGCRGTAPLPIRIP